MLLAFSQERQLAMVAGDGQMSWVGPLEFHVC
jgi:hypothetical protein